MNYCSNCGLKLKENYNFCPSCGNAIKENTKEDEFLYEEVLKFVKKQEKISVGLIQKEFDLSYYKSNKIMSLLEERGIVGPQVGNKKRKVLANKSNEKEKIEERVKTSIENIMDTTDTTSNYDEKDIKENIILASLSYFSLLAFIPYFFHSNSKFVKYHATQGINLLIMWVIYTFLNNILKLIKISKVVVDFGGITGTKMVTPLWISLPLDIIFALLIAFSVIGVVYVLQGKAKELPLVGKIKIVK